MRRTTLLALALAATVPGTARAEGEPVPAVVAAPGSFLAGYATPAVAAPAGTLLWFANADLPNHDVVSVAEDAFGAPLFRSRIIGIGKTAPVEGSDEVPPGTYAFYCTLHPNMTGTYVVV